MRSISEPHVQRTHSAPTESARRSTSQALEGLMRRTQIEWVAEGMLFGGSTKKPPGFHGPGVRFFAAMSRRTLRPGAGKAQKQRQQVRELVHIGSIGSV